MSDKTHAEIKKLVEEYYKFSEANYPDGWYTSIRMDGRIEYNCKHGVGHGTHVHGCDTCCDLVSYPINRGHHSELPDDWKIIHASIIRNAVRGIFARDL